MASLFSQLFFTPAPTLTETNCPTQAGRVFIVTGGYSGVGFELSKILYSAGGIVYIAGRSQSKGLAAITQIKDTCQQSSGRLEFLDVDLADLSTVRRAVDEFQSKESRRDVLVNNAAIMFPPDELSKDAQGNDVQMTVNCIAHCLLYQLLLPLLSKTAAHSPRGTVRVIWAGSVGIDIASPKPGGIILEKSGQPKESGSFLNYNQSKVANLFLCREFAKDTPENGIVHACFNPGNLLTGLQRHWHTLGSLVTHYLLLRPPIYGAYTELFAAIAPEVSVENSGAYIIPHGRIGSFRSDIQAALQPPADGGSSNSARFTSWCLSTLKPYTEVK